MPPGFDGQDPDDLEDFFLVNGFFDVENSSANDSDPADSGDGNRNNDNLGCGTTVLLVIMVLLLSFYLCC
jgi:hypothetical protein